MGWGGDALPRGTSQAMGGVYKLPREWFDECTIFTAPTRQTSDFAAILRHVAATTTDEVRVRVTSGRCDYTNYVQARGKFGNSRIGITFAGSTGSTGSIEYLNRYVVIS